MMIATNVSGRSYGTWIALLLSLLSIAGEVSAFGIIKPSSIGRPATRLSAQPKPKPFDPSYKAKPPTFNKATSLWEPSVETEEQPYGPWGSFLRGGPAPFVVRALNPADYDQAVFKYMAQTGCSRAEAQGNMDAFFNNAADWAYQKGEEARGRPVVDYTELKPKQAALVVTWALFVTPFLGRCAYLIAFTDKGWEITLDDVLSIGGMS
eukprot:CAMPEP_0172535350 /NCGR_PEP_ID=MMETSP1067-20121228/7403_1 /TAXON_ID=265564 ORGANISM="Thalassiosira punctigera, Strain Tpunct2005C2" /NCGR_SAMPLE_ID=MMETSP1067 /ASSEMBLY_ACC=CAM_ASM_000444 /LENGTH=207 /DNA_ID=CAMNT_0013320281 /DNA_START=96 /DNA_END=719 /DNA_ORIENTATION=+